MGDVAASSHSTLALLQSAFDRFLRVYAVSGSHRFYGWNDYGDGRNYKGPLLWTEGDCAFRFALALEAVFPGLVHFEFPIARWSVWEFDRERDRKQFVDVVVSDLSTFVEDDTSDERFRRHRHDLFVEVKHIGFGSERRWFFDARKKLPAIGADARRLAEHVNRNHCALAAILVVDDDCIYESNRDLVGEIPSTVVELVASPRQLHDRGIATDASTPVYRARQIVAGDGTLAEKRKRLQRLAVAHPRDTEVLRCFESFQMQSEVERTLPPTRTPTPTSAKHETTPMTPGRQPGLSPDSAGFLASRVMYGPGTLEEKAAALHELAARFPDSGKQVLGYLESLAMEKELQEGANIRESRPPGWKEWTRDVRSDSSFLDSPPPEYVDEDDEEQMAQVREHQARLRDEGVELLTPED